MVQTPSDWGPIAPDLPRIWKACQEADGLNEDRRIPAPCTEFEAKFYQVAAFDLSALTLERLMARCGDIFRPIQIGQLALLQHRPSLALIRVGSHDDRGRVNRDLRDEEISANLKRFRDQEPMLPGIERTVHLWLGMGPQRGEGPRPVFVTEYDGVTALHVIHVAAPAIASRGAAWETATSSDRVTLDLTRIA